MDASSAVDIMQEDVDTLECVPLAFYFQKCHRGAELDSLYQHDCDVVFPRATGKAH